MTTTKLTAGLLRHIIKEEVAAVREELTSSRATQAAPRRSPPPEGSFDDFERGYKKRELDMRWDALSKRWPRQTAKVGREAFEAEYESRSEGAAGGGSSLGSGDIYALLLDLLDEGS